MTQTAKDTTNTSGGHSNVVGGSTAARVLACPGSVKLNQGVKQGHLQRIYDQIKAEEKPVGWDHEWPDVYHHTTVDPNVVRMVNEKYREETTSPYAQEGTALHEAIAHILDKNAHPTSVIDEVWEGVEITHTLYHQALAPAIQGWNAYLDKVFEEDGEEMRYMVERRGAFPGVAGAFGTADVVACTSKRLTIWDWKFGAGVEVSPDENAQLMFYGRAAAHTSQQWLASEGLTLAADTRVDLVISQPRTGDGKPKVWTTTYDRLNEFRKELVAAVAEAQGDSPKVKRGAHCKWCSAATHNCPAMYELGKRIIDRIKDAEENKTTPTANFKPDELSQWLEDATVMEGWVKSVRSLGMSELESGRSVPGRELDQGLGNATWVDGVNVDTLLSQLGLPAKERRVTKPLSPTQARSRLKGDMTDRQKTKLESNIHRPLGALKMVREGTAKNPPKTKAEVYKNLGDFFGAMAETDKGKN